VIIVSDTSPLMNLAVVGADEIAEYYLANYYDQAVAHTAALTR
jgi:hypothetical protein